MQMRANSMSGSGSQIETSLLNWLLQISCNGVGMVNSNNNPNHLSDTMMIRYYKCCQLEREKDY